MITRTLPTRDVTLSDGRRLYYQQDLSRQHAALGTSASVYQTKRGPAGALRVLLTIDDLPERGEHYHLSASYPDHMPTPDEMLAVVAALLPGGRYGALTPERNRHALHGHVVHLVEETPTYVAQREASSGAEAGDVYAQTPPPAPADADAPPDGVAEILEAVRVELGLAPPFTTERFREALDRLRARRGLEPGALPPYTCTERNEAGTGFVIPYPADAPRVDQEHAKYHGLAHVMLKHQPLAAGIYTAAQERDAEAMADALMTVSLNDVPANEGA